MKILVLSDSHLNLSALISIFEAEKPDVVFGAGDHSKDLEELSYVKEEAYYYIVRGNCDYFDKNQDDILKFDLKGYKFMLTHGHLYGVKRDLDELKSKGQRWWGRYSYFRTHTHTLSGKRRRLVYI